MKAIIIPAILSSTREDYEKKIRAVEGLVERVQVDVMDGRFVPNKTVPLDKLTGIHSKVYKEFHMMVDAPWAYIPIVAQLGGGTYIFHIEACTNERNVHDILQRIRQYKMKPAIAINPETPLKTVLPYINELEQVLIMSVHPGKMGQAFISSVLRKIRELRKRKPKLTIEVDGGINAETLPKVLKAGANYFVIGSAIYGREDIKEAVKKYKKIIICEKQSL